MYTSRPVKKEMQEAYDKNVEMYNQRMDPESKSGSGSGRPAGLSGGAVLTDVLGGVKSPGLPVAKPVAIVDPMVYNQFSSFSFISSLSYKLSVDPALAMSGSVLQDVAAIIDHYRDIPDEHRVDWGAKPHQLSMRSLRDDVSLVSPVPVPVALPSLL